MRRLPTRVSSLVTSEVQGEVLVLEPANGMCHVLSAEASLLWTHCDGIVTAVEAAHATGLSLEAVERTADELVDLGLAAEATRSVVSRRAALQRGAVIGGGVLASTVLLPRLANAVSVIGGGGGGNSGATYGDSTTAVAIPSGAQAVVVETITPYTIAAAGTVVSWSTLAYNGGQALVLLRPGSSANAYTVVYSSPVQALPNSSALRTFPVPNVAVQAGDLVGMWTDVPTVPFAQTANPADAYSYEFGAPPAAGSTVTMTGAGTGFRYSMSVRLA